MERILVVDDDPSMRHLLREVLVSSGYQVIEAADGSEGFRKAQEEAPSLVIADVLMPVQDGYQLARNLRKSPVAASVPILMLTGLREEKDELKAFQEGVDEYIVKPFRAPVLLARVAALLSRSRALRGEAEGKAPATSEVKAAPGRVSSGCHPLDDMLGGGLPRGTNLLLAGETGCGKSTLCRRFLAAALENSDRTMMITLDDEPLMIRQSLDALLTEPVSKYEAEGKFRLVDGYSWTRGSAGSGERFAVSGLMELNQLAGAIADAGKELGQSLTDKAGGCRVFDSVSSLFINFELASVQRFLAQLARTATSYGGVTTLFVVEAGAVTEQALNNIRYVMDGLLEMKSENGCYYVRVASMKWTRFSRDWIEVKE